MAGTPLTVISGKVLLDNSGIDINPELPIELDRYKNSGVLSSHLQTVETLQAHAGDANSLSGTTIINIQDIFKSTMPFLSNHSPPGISTEYLTDYIMKQAENQNGGPQGAPNNGAYIAMITAVTGYIAPLNDAIKTAVEGSKLAGSTFTTMDALSSGNILAIANPAQTFGQDMKNTGELYDFKKMDLFSTPHGLLDRLDDLGYLGLVTGKLEDAGVPECDLPEFKDDEPPLDEATQKKVYGVFSSINGNEFREIADVFNITTAGLSKLTDLLDVSKMFPNSKNEIMSLNAGTPDNIFSNGNPKPWVNQLVTPQVSVMPPPIARSAMAMNISLQQVADLKESNAEKLGNAAINLETNAGLAAIEDQTAPVPQDIVQYYIDTMGKGSGENGTFKMTDGVGTAAGVPHVANFKKINDTISAMNNDLYTLVNNANGIFFVMRQVATGVYDSGATFVADTEYDSFAQDYRDPLVSIPIGTHGYVVVEVKEEEEPPEFTEYPNRNSVINYLYNLAVAEVNRVNSIHIYNIVESNEAYDESSIHVGRELLVLKGSFIQFDETYNEGYNRTEDDPKVIVRDQLTVGFATALTAAGEKTDEGEVADIMVKMATDDGQSIVAALREGRNKKKLAESGVKSKSDIKT